MTSFAAIGRRCIGLANRFADGPYRKPKRAIWKTMWLSESFKGVDLENSLVIAGIAYPLRIRRHARARSFRLSVDSAKREVRLGLPTRASLHKALQWVRGQEAWLEKQLAALPDGIALVQGEVFLFVGSDVRIDWSPLAARRVMLWGGWLKIGGAGAAIAPRALRWLRTPAGA